MIRDPVLEPSEAEQRRRIWNWFHHEKLDTYDIARALGLPEADVERKLSRIFDAHQTAAR
jgi:DNA-binding transcriptional regulator LsrR (DeoR family)